MDFIFERLKLDITFVSLCVASGSRLRNIPRRGLFLLTFSSIGILGAFHIFLVGEQRLTLYDDNNSTCI